MFYYRYRTPTEINFKELLYDEIYFASPSECNDPFDSKTYFEFTNEQNKWNRLLMLAWQKREILFEIIDVDIASKLISDHCPLQYDFIVSNDFQKMLLDVVIASVKSNNRNFKLLWEATQRVLDILHLYKMSMCYFVSFSKTNNETLMWSHYSAKHEGYCLIFKSIDGKLKQCPKRLKKAFYRETPGGLASSMSFGIPECFPFQDVIYVSEVKPLNAFYCFPGFVAGNIPCEEDRLKLCSEQFEQYLQKHISWSYEKESRLTMPQPTPWLFGGHYDYSVQERLLHYEPTQLVGLILGARISEQNKLRLIEIIKDHQERISRSDSYKRIIFDFVVFEAKLAHGAREVKIEPIEIHSLSKTIKPNEHDFSRRYSEWENGFGLCFDGKSCSKVCIKS